MSFQEGTLDTSEQNLPSIELQGRISYSDSEGFWGKVANGLRSVGQVAQKALPYIADVFSAANSSYGTNGSYGMRSGPDNLPIYEHYSSTRNHAVKPLTRRTVSSATYRPMTQKALGQLQEFQRPQKMNMNQLAANTRRMLNEVANAQGLPSYEQFQRNQNLVSTSQPDRASSGIEQYFENQSSQRPRRLMQEDRRQIAENLSQGQKPWTLAEQLQFQQIEFQARQEEEARQAALWEQQQKEWARQAAAQLRQKAQSPVKSKVPFKAQVTKSRQESLLDQAFRDPTHPEQSILEQSHGLERLPESKLKQTELNLDHLLAKEKITASEYQALAIAAKAAVAQNWLRHDGQEHGNGTVTYQGITLDQRDALQVAYADAEHYWNQETHLTPQRNWMKQVEKSISGLFKGLANGTTAGAGPKVSAGEEGAYAVGDLLGAIGVNAAALLTGALTPTVWVSYGVAREANREVDAGKPLNPVAIAASGAISAIPGTAAAKVPLGVAGKIGTGLATGYASDIANRGVQQLGDIGQIDPRTLDYRPGFGTVAGGVTGLLFHPAVSQAFQKYLLGRQSQLLNGEKVPISYEDFVAHLKREYNLTDADIAYYENRSSTPPTNHPFNRPIWSAGPINNPLLNAYNHSTYPNHPDAYGVKSGDIRYLQQTHQLLDNIPKHTELMETKAGMKRYYSPGAGPQGQTIFTVEEPTGAPRTSYIPDGTPQEQYEYFRSRGGKYKGRIK